MTQEENKAQISSFGITSYALACYQGRFAMLTVLKAGSHPFFKDTELEKTKKIITELLEIKKTITDGHQVFNEDNSIATNQDQLKIITNLKSLQPEFESLAKKIKSIIVSETFYNNNLDATLLLAALAREAYFIDNIEKNQTELAQLTNNSAYMPMKQPFLQNGAEKVNVINLLVKRATENNNEIEKNDLPRLGFAARILASVFRAQIHEIKQFTHGAKSPFTYEKAGFLQVEAQTWASYGFDPIVAGYWRAFEVSVEDAYQWIQHGVTSPLIVAEWKTAGFTPIQTLEWLNVLFPPLLAIQWGNAGYHPQEAALLLQSGFSLPEDISREKAIEIIEEKVKEIQAKQDAA
jgi:hypothetical protein